MAVVMSRRARAVLVFVGLVVGCLGTVAAPVAQAAPLPDVTAHFHPLPPVRILDSRDGTGGRSGRLGAGEVFDLAVVDKAGVPASGVSSVVVNVTVTQVSAATDVRLWPTGQPTPEVSNLNAVAGQTVPNLVTVRVGDGGKVSIRNNSGQVHVIADLAGWYDDGSVGGPPGGGYHAVSPSRILDTREGNGAPTAKVGEGAEISLAVAGRGGVPSAGATAVVMNLTGEGPTAATDVRAWPDGEPKPNVSNLNLAARQTTPNLVIVKIGANGQVRLRNNSGAVNLIADVAGWYDDGTDPTGAGFHPLSPVRTLDTRSGLGAPAAKLGPAGELSLGVGGTAGVPATGATAVVMNVTAVGPTAITDVRAWPDGEAMPNASNLNPAAGQTVPNLVMVKIGSNSKVRIRNSSGQVDVIADVAGWFDEGKPPEVGGSLGSPPLDPTVPMDLGDATAFLYSGPDPLQKGVAPGTIDERRVAVLRGRVRDVAGAALAGVTVTVLGRPEYGHTLTRDDGMFDLAVNGGVEVTVEYEKDGYTSVQRAVEATKLDYGWADEVVLTPVAPVAGTVDLGSANWQTVQAPIVSDPSGTRRTTLLVPPGTGAVLRRADGTTQPAGSRLTIRATELTVGASGPQAMPGELPPTSAYTYAVELSADEAEAAGAEGVNFSQPVLSYVENFLGIPVGTVVPNGHYDATSAAWVPDRSGRVIAIVSISAGMANVDLDGDGVAEDGPNLSLAGLTVGERQRLAARFTAGTSLWRVPLGHFSAVDFNYAKKNAPDAQPPPPGIVRTPPTSDSNPLPPPSDKTPCFSTVVCRSGELREDVAITGTDLSLSYSSGRAPAATSYDVVTVYASGATVPSSLRGIDVEVSVAGQSFRQSLPPDPDQVVTWQWDGKDAYGRPVVGLQRAVVRVGWRFPSSYQSADGFGEFGNGLSLSLSAARQEATYWRTAEQTVGSAAPAGERIGGWTIDQHHQWDKDAGTVLLGDGGVLDDDPAPGLFTRRIAGGGQDPNPGAAALDASLPSVAAMAYGPDGSLYVAGGSPDSGPGVINRITPAGVVERVVGNGALCDNDLGACGEGLPGPEVAVRGVPFLTFDAAGTLVFVDRGRAPVASLQVQEEIRRVGPDGTVTTLVKGPTNCGDSASCGDGLPAAQASISQRLTAMTSGPDGAIYFADGGTIRRIGTDGIVRLVAGQYQTSCGQYVCGPYCEASGPCGDGGLAKDALLTPWAMDFGPDGSLYFVDAFNSGGRNDACTTCGERIRRIDPSGIVTPFAFTGQYCEFGQPCGDGGPAASATLRDGNRLIVDDSGTVYVSQFDRVRAITPDGRVGTAAGGGSCDQGARACIEGQIATATNLTGRMTSLFDEPGPGFVLGLDTGRVLRVGLSTEVSADEFEIPSPNASELFVFDDHGRHVRTVDVTQGFTIRSFEYDTAGRVSAIVDRDGDRTVIERGSAGTANAIVGPFGQRTTLAYDVHGYLAQITAPDGSTRRFTSSAGGLITEARDQRGGLETIAYDELGRVTRVQAPDQRSVDLTAATSAEGQTVTRVTGEGRTTVFETAYSEVIEPHGYSTGVAMKVTNPDGSQSAYVQTVGGATTRAEADGTTARVEVAGDPRFGGRLLVSTSSSVTLPSGLQLASTTDVRATPSAPDQLLVRNAMDATTSVNGRAYRQVFEPSSDTVSSWSPEYRTTVASLDGRGRPTQVVASGFAPVSTTYDGHGRPTATTQGTRTTTTAYGSDGLPASVTDPANRQVSFTRDAMGRPTRLALPGGREVSVAYDAAGNVTSVTPPGRPAHTFSYTAGDQVASFVAPGNRTTTFTYDTDRQPTAVHRPGGLDVAYAYDTGGRLTSMTLPTGARTIAYDAQGRTSQVAAPGGQTTAYGYDGGLITSETWTGPVSGTIGRTYDDDLWRTSDVVGGTPAVSYGYDRDGLLTAAGSLSLHRIAESGLVDGTDLGQVHTSATYDEYGELVTERATANGTDLIAVTYERDVLGRVTKRTETIGGTTHVTDYAYDPAGRLASVEVDGAATAAYLYDANGNRLSVNRPGGNETGAYNERDELVSYGGGTYSYNDAGQLLSTTKAGKTTSYQHDAIGNLVAVDLPTGKHVAYGVDALDRRVSRTVDGVTKKWLYDDLLRPIAELDGASAVVSRFVYADAGNVPAYLVRGASTYRLVTDQLGSVRLVVDVATGAVTQRIDYDEFGRVVGDTSPGFQPFGFAGGLHDPLTGLVHFGARVYDPVTGRWTTTDPIGFQGGDTNLYAYVGGDPVNAVDPTGRRGQGYRALQAALSNAAIGFADGITTVPGTAISLNKLFRDEVLRKNGWACGFQEDTNSPGYAIGSFGGGVEQAVLGGGAAKIPGAAASGAVDAATFPTASKVLVNPDLVDAAAQALPGEVRRYLSPTLSEVGHHMPLNVYQSLVRGSAPVVRTLKTIK